MGIIWAKQACKRNVWPGAQFKTEKRFWREFVDRLEFFDDKNHVLKSIINSTKIL